MRTCLVFMTAVIVIHIPDFSNMMALVGSTCCTLLGFILPGIFHWKLFERYAYTNVYTYISTCNYAHTAQIMEELRHTVMCQRHMTVSADKKDARAHQCVIYTTSQVANFSLS